MGGTFDPIHHGHLVAASEVQQSFDLDEVVFVPTGQPWMKEAVSTAERRYEMTVIATASNPRFSVSRVDIQRAGPTYTIDTLRDVRREQPDAELFFISGADAAPAAVRGTCGGANGAADDSGRSPCRAARRDCSGGSWNVVMHFLPWQVPQWHWPR